MGLSLNRFQSQEDQIFDDMLEEDFGQTVTFQFEDLPPELQTNRPPGEPPKDDGSFVSFGTMLDAKRPPTTPTTMGTDSLSSPYR